MANASLIMLNWSCGSGHPCLVTILEWKLSVLGRLLWGWILLCHSWLLSDWDKNWVFTFFIGFYDETMLHFVKCFLHLLIWCCGYCVQFYWCGTLHFLSFVCWIILAFLEWIWCLIFFYFKEGKTKHNKTEQSRSEESNVSDTDFNAR